MERQVDSVTCQPEPLHFSLAGDRNCCIPAGQTENLRPLGLMISSKRVEF